MTPSPSRTNHIRFFLSTELSDVTIQYEHGLLPVHKIILAQASEYFKTLFTGSFAETGQRIVELKDDPPLALQGMIAWIYGMQYSPQHRYHNQKQFSSPIPDDDKLEFAKYQVDLFFTAEKYLLSRLATSVEGYFFHVLLAVVFERPEHLHDIARYVYITRAEEAVELRKHVATRYIDKLQIFKSREDSKEVLSDIPDLAYDIIRLGAPVVGSKDGMAALSHRPSGGGAFPSLPPAR